MSSTTEDSDKWKRFLTRKPLYIYMLLFPWTKVSLINPLNSELNLICHLLALLGAHLILHFSRLRVKDEMEREKKKESYWHKFM